MNFSKKDLLVVLLISVVALLVANTFRYRNVIFKYDGIIKSYHKLDKDFGNGVRLVELFELEQEIVLQEIKNVKLFDENTKDNLDLFDLIDKEKICILVLFDQYVCGNCFNTFLRGIKDLQHTMIIHAASNDIRRTEDIKIVKALTPFNIYFDQDGALMTHLNYKLNGTPIILIINPERRMILYSYIYDINLKDNLDAVVNKLGLYLNNQKNKS